MPGTATGYPRAMTSTIGRGVLAGAVGTTLLNAVTYLDMALTGRSASDTPGRTVQRAAGRAGITPPDDDHLEAYGALGGIATGIGLGVAASVARSAGVRLPAPLGAVATGAMAMAATDGSMALLGVSDPREWSAAEWARDVVPHLAYGAGVRWTMDRVDSAGPTKDDVRRPLRARAGLVARSLALGVATGGRSSLALAGPMLAGRGRKAGLVAAGLVGTELVADKLPATPSRLQAGPLAVRLAGGGAGAVALARRDSAGVVLPAIAGVAGAALGSLAGAVWRDLAAERGYTWQAAAAEDAVALGLTAFAWR